MSKADKKVVSDTWRAAVEGVQRFLSSDAKWDEVLLRAQRELVPEAARRVQFLGSGVIRNLGLLESLLGRLYKKKPKKKALAVLLVSLWEWREADAEHRPKVVHHAVEQSKQVLSLGEARFINAVMRQFESLPEVVAGEDVASLAEYYSHPLWLVKRLAKQMEPERLKAWLAWNQQVPEASVCWLSREAVPSALKPTPWEGFYHFDAKLWPEVTAWIDAGKAYIQDPSTRIGSSLLSQDAGPEVLDLCAAPGGKSVQLMRRLRGREGLRLTALDVPGKRFERMQANLDRYASSMGVPVTCIATDLLKGASEKIAEASVDVIYLDVPCSNTGVLQRRPDAKWRLKPENHEQLAELQAAMLDRAWTWLKPGGSLVYSTCSVDRRENEGQVEAFCERCASATLVSGQTWYPDETGHDGCGAFLLQRKS